MDFQDAWQYLDKLQFFKIKLGLDSMRSFLAKVGEPQERFPAVHVAGTNGKGSVSATLLAILARAGYRVGLYTSPHLSSVRERFRINDEYIPEAEFAALMTRIESTLAGDKITYFECTTALAMLWFAERQVDLAILEVGLGGRLDATNVIRPLVGVITNVAMDHEAYLGHTLTAVATEKAGIMKAGVPMVSGVGDDESREVVVATAARLGAPLALLGRDFRVSLSADGSWSYRGPGEKPLLLSGLRCRLPGRHQIDNGAVALTALAELSRFGFPAGVEAMREGLARVEWPGRLEYFTSRGVGAPKGGGESRRYLLDGAHNPAGVNSLLAALRDEFVFEKLIVVWASMADKDVAGGLAAIAPVADLFIFTEPESERSARVETLRALLPPAAQADCHCLPAIGAALAKAHELAAVGDLICVAGSLYLVGKARAMLLGELVA